MFGAKSLSGGPIRLVLTVALLGSSSVCIAQVYVDAPEAAPTDIVDPGFPISWHSKSRRTIIYSGCPRATPISRLPPAPRINAAIASSNLCGRQ